MPSAPSVPSTTRGAVGGGDAEHDQRAYLLRGAAVRSSRTAMPRSAATCGAETWFTGVVEVALEEAGDGARGDRLGAEIGGLADALDLDRVRADARLGAGEEAPEARRRARRTARASWRPRSRRSATLTAFCDGAVREVGDDLLGDLERDAVLRLLGRRAEVRRHDDALVLDERDDRRAAARRRRRRARRRRSCPLSRPRRSAASS